MPAPDHGIDIYLVLILPAQPSFLDDLAGSTAFER